MPWSLLPRIRAQNPTLNGRFRSLSFGARDQIEAKVSSADKSDDKIKSSVSYVTARLDEYIQSGSPPLPLLYGAELYVHTDVRFKHFPEDSRLQILHTVADSLRYYQEVDKIQLYHANIYYRSMQEDTKDDLTKDLITDRVLLDTKMFPKVCHKHSVTEETHFFEDLGLDKWEFIDLLQALQMEFKLYIPYDVVSCKLAIEYIYEHRMERLHIDDFRNHLYLTGEYGESKSEFRRIFVPGVNKRRDNMMTRLHCQALSMHGLNLYKFFRNMKWFFPKRYL